MVDPMTKKQRISVLRILKKAKAYLDSPDKLVNDWGNFYEYKNGRQSGCSSHLTKKEAQKVCRVCALGATVVARYNFKLDGRDELARQVLDEVAYRRSYELGKSFKYFSFGGNHSLEEVHDLYDRAIEYVENL